MTKTIPDNEKTWTSDYTDVKVGYDSTEGAEYYPDNKPIYLGMKDIDDGYYDARAISLSSEHARAIAAHLIVLADDYDALKPKEPTRAERWAAAPIGTVITPGGKAYEPGESVYVKVGEGSWKSAESQGTFNVEDFHSSWDIAGTNS